MSFAVAFTSSTIRDAGSGSGVADGGSTVAGADVAGDAAEPEQAMSATAIATAATGSSVDVLARVAIG
jgi:hypothetical protein